MKPPRIAGQDRSPRRIHANGRRESSVGEFKRLLLELLPEQGHWSEEAYLWLTDHTNRLVEYTDGFLEPLPMPTTKHQAVLRFLFLAFHAFATPAGGDVHFSGLRLRVRPGRFREPDLLLLKGPGDPRYGERFWTGADLTLKVVSEDKPERDLIDKRGDYAEGRVPEYWIVNPLDDTITVLSLKGKRYVKHGVFRRGSRATSVILPGFSVNVADVFDAK
jgi:Uma2 family endonuclease